MCRYLKYSFLSGQEVNKDVPGYVGYIFQCESKSVVEDILQGLRSAFIAAHESARQVQYNRDFFKALLLTSLLPTDC